MRGYFNVKFLIFHLLILRWQSWNQQADLTKLKDIFIVNSYDTKTAANAAVLYFKILSIPFGWVKAPSGPAIFEYTIFLL